MTYNVFGGTLNLAQSINQSALVAKSARAFVICLTWAEFEFSAWGLAGAHGERV